MTVSRQVEDEWTSTDWGSTGTDSAGSEWGSGDGDSVTGTGAWTSGGDGGSSGAGGGGAGDGGSGDGGSGDAGAGWETAEPGPGAGWETSPAEPEDTEPEEGGNWWSQWWDETFGDGGDSEAAANELEEGEILAVEETFVPESVSGFVDDSVAVAPNPGRSSGSFVDLGRVGTRKVGDEADAAAPMRPAAFIDGGRTGGIAWAGGGGAGPHGNQSPGDVGAPVAPVYESRNNGTDADAWVRSGTGKIDVTRSWLGADGGDQGNGWFVTPAAAARLNNHEMLHVASSKGLYDANLAPLLARIADRSLGLNVASTEEKAIGALKGIIRWPESVSTYQTADKAANGSKPLGTIDTGDLKSGTYPVKVGPGVVAGKSYTQRLRLPSEPDPA